MIQLSIPGVWTRSYGDLSRQIHLRAVRAGEHDRLSPMLAHMALQRDRPRRDERRPYEMCWISCPSLADFMDWTPVPKR